MLHDYVSFLNDIFYPPQDTTLNALSEVRGDIALAVMIDAHTEAMTHQQMRASGIARHCS